MEMGDGDWHWGMGDGWYCGEVGGGEGSGVQMALGWGWSTLELYRVDMMVLIESSYSIGVSEWGSNSDSRSRCREVLFLRDWSGGRDVVRL